MLFPDPRAYRVALVADAIANEACASFDAIAMIAAADFGLVVLPPSDFEIPTIERIVEYVVDDLVDYRSNGYRVVLVGSSAIVQFGIWDDHVQAEVARRSIASFERFDIVGSTPESFTAFLEASVPPALVDG